MNGEKIRDLLIERLAQAKKQGKSVSYVATQEMGLSSATFLYDVRSGRREPSKRILDWLGIESVTEYKKKSVIKLKKRARHE